MTRFLFIFLLGIFSIPVEGQPVFKAVLSQQTVVMGESFQVQFIMEETERQSNFSPPDFKGFRIVSGPNNYKGSMVIRGEVANVKNLVYTLTALYPGYHKIKGAIAIFDQEEIRSNELTVEVIGEEEASKRLQKQGLTGNSEYFLRSGEDPNAKIRENLFVKVLVDQRSCYVGQPVLATFKLYSRLESKSDIVKNPGFYGFTVFDMINLADKQVSTENIRGKLFDVHTIRKVQLYPLQAGDFIIDEMEVKNRVEFSKSIVNKKTEQEIVEGVVNVPEEPVPSDASVFESEISTLPVSIHVKPIPEKNKPASFNGATGLFTIDSKIIKKPDSKNSEGIVQVSISGRGNFIQLDAPLIRWPSGLDGLEPAMKDSFDKTTTPLMGTRVFHYTFIANKAGDFTLAPVSFSYFNPDTGGYKTISTDPLYFTVKEEEIPEPVSAPGSFTSTRSKSIWLFGMFALIFSVAGLIYFFRERRKKIINKRKLANSIPPPFSIHELLTPANLSARANEPGFYHELQAAIWKFASHHFNLSGSARNKDLFISKLRQKDVNEMQVAELLVVLHQCEEGIFGKASTLADKTSLVVEVKELLEKVHEQLL